MVDVPSALHVNDAAFTAARLVAHARGLGYPWDLMPRAVVDPRWPAGTVAIRRALTGARWAGVLAVRARRHDIVHIHSASTLHHTRPVVRRFVLHCHGSDVRDAQYRPGPGRIIRAGLREAQAVFYSTPDLAQHVLPHRTDAIYLPVPVDVAALPAWSPTADRPRVVFASRWEAVKGLPAQLETARRIIAAVGPDVDVVGLDWGPGAADAAAAGVRLLARMDHPAYLRLLAGARAVVGQAAGILSSSELEALGTGAPLVVPSPLLATGFAAPPVLGHDPESAAAAVVDLLDGTDAGNAAARRGWVSEHHGVERAVSEVADVYRSVMAARRA